MSRAMRKPKAPEVNRARILDAAIEEFAARGFKAIFLGAMGRKGDVAGRRATVTDMILRYVANRA